MPPIVAENAGDLLRQLSKIKIAVPGRSERTTEDVERWSTARFLSTYARSSLIRYPIRITPRDRPDVLLAFPNTEIGIEITEAVPTNWAKTSALHEDHDYENVMFIPHCKPGESPRSTAELDRIARGEDMGVPWVGDSPEREWAEAMLHSTNQKAAKVVKPGFSRFDHDWLLIYDNWPLPSVDEEAAAYYFRDLLLAAKSALPFHAVFVEGSKHFWHFKDEQMLGTQINDLWKDS